VELGASIFVKINHILYNATETFHLNVTQHDMGDDIVEEGPTLGIYDGEIFVFKQNKGTSWWSDIARLVWRYGLAPLRTQNLMKDVTGRFLQMYDKPYFPFASLTDTLYTLGLLENTGVTGEQLLKEKGVGDLFAREIVQASTRVNYAQNLNAIHGVEAMVCMAADSAMAVEGGNWRIFEAMTKEGAEEVRLSAEVTGLERHKDGTFTLTSKDLSGKRAVVSKSEEKYDTIILAAPYQFSGLNISPKPQHTPNEIPYVNLHVTLFTSPHALAPGAFKLKSTDQVPAVILTTLSDGEVPGTKPIPHPGKAGFFSISTLRRITNPKTKKEEFLYKIFSPEEIGEEFLARILGVSAPESGELPKEDVSWIYRKLWQSYPYELPRVTFEELRLDENLWYTSGIESFISTMETSALMGRNVANLIVDEWVSQSRRDSFDSFVKETQKPLKAKL